VRIVRGAEEGRRTLLHRQPLGETELPAAIRKKNAELFGADLPVDQQVRRVLDDVRREGDAAVSRYTKAFTGADYTSLEVSRDEISTSYERVDPSLVEALREAADHIRAYHLLQREHSSRSFSERGVGMQVRRLAMYSTQPTARCNSSSRGLRSAPGLPYPPAAAA